MPFDPRFFEKRAQAGKELSLRNTFEHIYETSHWGSAHTPSGHGASADQTAQIVRRLPQLFLELGVNTLLDVPCGDAVWIRNVLLPDVEYIGGDIVPSIVLNNNRQFANPVTRFQVIDLTSDELPSADLILCRDCLVHLSFNDAMTALQNILRSDMTYLLTTTFSERRTNTDIVTGDWRPLNLQIDPFGFPAPLQLIVEGCTEGGGAFVDKALGLWRIEDLRALSITEDDPTAGRT
jgi:hypothetical protein